MRGNLFFSLRFRLVALVLLTVLPALMLLAFFSWEQRRHALEEARQKARTLALVSSQQLNDVIAGQENILYTLSLLPQAKGRDLAALNLIFAELLKKPAGVLGYRLADAQGRLLGGVPPPARPTSYADRDWFRRLQKTRRFQVSDFVIGKTIPQPIMPLAYPVLNSRGEIDGILIASFSVGWLDDYLKKCGLPPRTHVLLIDRQGTILAIYPHAGEKVGQSLPQSPLIRAMLDRREGFVEAGCLGEDIPVIYAFTDVGEGEEPLKLAVGFEKALVLGQVSRDFLFHLSLLGLAAGLALAGSLAFGHLLIRRPVLRILKATQRVAAGDLEARTGLPAGKGELNRLGQAFDEMTASLQQREAQRRQAEEAFQILVNHAPVGIFIVQDGNFKMVNPGFEKISGYPKEELLDGDSLCRVSPDYREVVRASAIRMLKGELDQAYEFPIITKRGETRWVLEKVTSTSYQGKRATLGYFIDISEHKSLESQFLQAQKMEAVGTLAGGIAHDFNNILTAILGNIGLAMLDAKIGPRVQDRLAQTEEACLRAQALSQQLLTFAKVGAPIKKLFSVAELLTESTTFACVGSLVRCETTFPENLWCIEGDPGQIGQVFQNLTINAIQAMPTGGTIKVWAENLTLGTDSGLPLSAGRYIKISVRDQGMGVPAEHLPRIFDPYFTTKQKGSGLGLASTYAIIKKHHGHIAVESKPRVGTTFNIYLPAVEQQATPQPEEDRELLVGKGKILVMDDEEMVREVLGRMLARLGYEAEFAGDGGEAIEMFVQTQGSGQAFAAAIIDLTVPGGMGGKEAMAKLLEIDPQVKAIVSSGYSDDQVMADFQKYGFSGVIAKPYRISELGKILHEVIMGKP